MAVEVRGIKSDRTPREQRLVALATSAASRRFSARWLPERVRSRGRIALRLAAPGRLRAAAACTLIPAEKNSRYVTRVSFSDTAERLGFCFCAFSNQLTIS